MKKIQAVLRVIFSLIFQKEKTLNKRIKIQTLLLGGIVCILGGCSYTIPPAKNKINYRKVKRIDKEARALQSGNLNLDTIRIDGTKASLVGDFFVVGDTLCFADEIVSSILFYDTTGQFIGTAISKGKGPNEVLSIAETTPAPEGGCIIIDGQWIVYEINSQWEKTKQTRIDWPPILDEEECIKHPDPNDGAIYEIEYGKKHIRVYDEKHLIFPISTSHVNFNGYYPNNHATEYYREAYNIGIFSRDSLRLERMLCNYPPIYGEYRYLSAFSYPLFELQGHNLIFSFEPDSNIYVMDLRDSIVQSFGHAGSDMNTAYPEYLSLEENYENYSKDYETYGYYRYLFLVPQKELLFRGYRKGESPLPDGLQIYKNYQYVGNYDVPRGFEVIGYIHPYFYAAGTPDYDNEEMIVYRFKLDDYE